MAEETVEALTLEATEEGTYVLNLAFLDEDSIAVIPTSATWTLTDAYGNVINGRSGVNITGLAATKDVVLAADDLAIPDGVDANVVRHFRVTYSYNSSLGSLTHSEEVKFTVLDHKAQA